MICKALIQPREVWDFYIKNEKRLEKEMVLVAGTISGSYEFYITVDDGTPCFEVYERGSENIVERMYFVTEDDASLTAKTVYKKYYVYFEDDEDKEEEEEEENRIIDEREEVLLQAFESFVNVATDGDMLFQEVFQTKEMALDALDHVLEYLVYECDATIYRPCHIEDDKGKAIFVEYPYEDYDVR